MTTTTNMNVIEMTEQEHEREDEKTIKQCEKEIIGLLALLFEHKRKHGVLLDDRDIGTDVGYAPIKRGEYFHYVNGDVLHTSDRKFVMYENLTYIDEIEPNARVWIQRSKVACIAISPLMYGVSTDMVYRGERRFENDIRYICQLLHESVLKTIYDEGLTGRNRVSPSAIERGISIGKSISKHL